MARLVKARVELWDAGMFPVMTGKDYGREEGACVPLALVLPHENQAQRNHSQTLHRLAERGGLSACELAAVLEDREWRSMPEHEAWGAIFRAAVTVTRPEALSATDSLRLDWLSLHKGDISYFRPGVKWNGIVKKAVELEWYIEGKAVFVDADTIREAIDLALAIPMPPSPLASTSKDKP